MKKLILFLLFFSLKLNAQVFQYNENTELIRNIKLAIDKIYNQDFEGAERDLRCLKEKFPENPAYHLAVAIAIYWNMMPDLEQKKGTERFHRYLDTVIIRSKFMLQQNPNDVEQLFYQTSAYGFKAGKYVDDGNLLLAIKQAERAYSNLKEVIDGKYTHIEFNFPHGLYDYFVVKFPEIQPLAKPLMIFFPPGNKIRGLDRMRWVAENGLFTRSESEVYLMRILLRYENNPSEALHYSRVLTARYPKNLYFASFCSEALIELGRYKEAEIIISKLRKHNNLYYQAIAYEQKGWIAEIRDKNYEQAINYYIKAISLSEQRKVNDKRILGLSNLGLGRCYYKSGNKQLAKDHLKTCLKYLEYAHWIKEAESLLKK